MQVTRWRRYGKDRLYVQADDGADVGWWDLTTDEGHPASPEVASLLVDEVAAWRVGAGPIAGTATLGMQQSMPDTSSPAVSPDVRYGSPELEWVDGVAGGSASHEFQRRHDSRLERVQARHPKVGKFLLAVFDDPQSTRAWSVGARGESELGRALEPMAGPSLRVLHDRRIPRTTANIDHLVVCSSGVFVIDSKRYVDSRPQLRVEGGLIRPRTELLFVGGRDRTRLVDGMEKQLGLVRAALEDQPEVTVRGVLCFIDADWPVLGGDFMVRDVAVVWPKKLYKMLVEPGPLEPERVAALQWQLHEAFPRAKSRPDLRPT